jgi:hypothetical protein
MSADNIAGRHQSKPYTSLARACKGFEQLVPKFGLNSWTGIRYLDYQAARVPQGHYLYHAPRWRMLKRILDEIIQCFRH